jgi:hypothetical protein
VPAAGAARLDGGPLPLAFDALTKRGTAAVDLQRYTGFHQLFVQPDRQYLFGTQDAKLRIDGVVEMLDFLATQAAGLGLAWSGVLQFSGTGRVLRDPRLDAAWLERCGPEVIRLGRAIARAPRSRSAVIQERASHGVPDITGTLSLLRRNTHLLDEHASGPIEVGGQRWIPREIVRRRRVSSVDTPGNRAATRLLAATRELVRATRTAAPAGDALRLVSLEDDLTALLRSPPFQVILRQRNHLRLVSVPSDERRDPRYRRVRVLLDELLRDRQWDPSTALNGTWAFAAVADKVYQTFAALMVAHAMGLKPLESLDGDGPHFGDERYHVWVDRTPPAEVLADWREGTIRKSALRPDITVLDRESQQVAVLDAKYRSTGDRATAESLTEVQLYLQAYGQSGAMILYPPSTTQGPWASHDVTDGRFRLIEMPLRPGAGLIAHMQQVVVPGVMSLMAPTAAARQAGRARDEELGDEVTTAAGQRAAVETLLTATENHLRRSLPGTWDLLGDEIQRMLVTAEYFGDQIPEGYDHSGPVLGVFAACERLITDRIFVPLQRDHPAEFHRVTLGQAAYYLKATSKSRGDLAVRLVRAFIAQDNQLDGPKLAKCGGVLLGINKWRQAAAHSRLVDKTTWDAAHRAIIGEGSGLLHRIAEALN